MVRVVASCLRLARWHLQLRRPGQTGHSTNYSRGQSCLVWVVRRLMPYPTLVQQIIHILELITDSARIELELFEFTCPGHAQHCCWAHPKYLGHVSGAK